jgi:hypothetical protein
MPVNFSHTVDDTISVLSATNSFAIHNNVSLGTNNSEWNEVLMYKHREPLAHALLPVDYIYNTYTNAFIQSLLLLIVFFALVGIQADVVESQFLLNLLPNHGLNFNCSTKLRTGRIRYSLLEGSAFFQSQSI